MPTLSKSKPTKYSESINGESANRQQRHEESKSTHCLAKVRVEYVANQTKKEHFIKPEHLRVMIQTICSSQ